MDNNNFFEKNLNMDDNDYFLAQNDEAEYRQVGFTLKEEGNPYLAKRNGEVTCWEPVNFNLETTTIWSFPQRGD